MSHLTTGDFAPWFIAASSSNPTYHFDAVGGYRVILSFLGSTKNESSRQVLLQFADLQSQLETLDIPFFGVSIDPDDLLWKELITTPSYFKLIWDFDQKVSILYDVCPDPTPHSRHGVEYCPTTFVLNQNLQILGVFKLQNSAHHVQEVMNCVNAIPLFDPPQIAARQAPVLCIPNVLNRDFCNHLIHLYAADGGSDSGFMRQIDGKTVEVFDYAFKKRRDLLLEDRQLLQQLNMLILRRVKPQIEKAFQFTISRFERHLVGCYEASDRGFFNRHRDNTTKGTAHRRFAMSLNLNTGEYDGGYLWFPEYGSQLYRPEVGEAVIFSCSLLHEATPVTSGRRFALLSFFYNDDDAKLRDRNRKYLATSEASNPTSTDTSQPSTNQSKPGFQPVSRAKTTTKKSKR